MTKIKIKIKITSDRHTTTSQTTHLNSRKVYKRLRRGKGLVRTSARLKGVYTPTKTYRIRNYRPGIFPISLLTYPQPLFPRPDNLRDFRETSFSSPKDVLPSKLLSPEKRENTSLRRQSVISCLGTINLPSQEKRVGPRTVDTRLMRSFTHGSMDGVLNPIYYPSTLMPFSVLIYFYWSYLTSPKDDLQRSKGI